MEIEELCQSLIKDMARIKSTQAALRRQITDATTKMGRVLKSVKVEDSAPDLDTAERVMRTISDKPGIARTKLLQLLQRSLDANALTIALRFLIESGMIEEKLQRPKKGLGRPSASYWPAVDLSDSPPA